MSAGLSAAGVGGAGVGALTAVSPADASVAVAGAAVSIATVPADSSDRPLHELSDTAVSANAHVTATMCTTRGAGDRVFIFSSRDDERRQRPATVSVGPCARESYWPLVPHPSG